MIREHLFERRAPADPSFRWRGGEISRLEGLSDGVFAVTLTLLVATVQVPSTFYELWLTIRDLPVFLVCFAMLMMVWRYHYIFFRRYGLEDFATQVINGAFLFLVIFYAFPLKFLANFLWRLIISQPVGPMFALPPGVDWGQSQMLQSAGMMYFYGAGVIGVFGLLALMVWRAYRLRDVLEFDEVECLLTRQGIAAHLISVGVAATSILVLWLTDMPGWSGVVYFAMGPLQAGLGIGAATRVARLEKQRAAPGSIEDEEAPALPETAHEEP